MAVWIKTYEFLKFSIIFCCCFICRCSCCISDTIEGGFFYVLCICSLGISLFSVEHEKLVTFIMNNVSFSIYKFSRFDLGESHLSFLFCTYHSNCWAKKQDIKHFHHFNMKIYLHSTWFEYSTYLSIWFGPNFLSYCFRE